MGESDDTYTDDDRPPQSNVPIDVQITVTVWFSALVVAVILIGCCISRRGCWFHSELNSMLRGLNTFSSPCTKITMKRPRAGGLGSTNPLLSGRLSLLCSRFISHRITCDSTLPPMRRDEEIVLQTYVLTWKLLTEKSRSQTLLATYFGLPLLGLFTCWLLYAIFSTKHSSGELEQYVTGLSLVFVTQSVSANVVAEKSLKLRESLRQMGVRDVAYWFSLVIIVETLVMGTCLALLEATGAVSFRLFHSVGRGYSQTWTSQDSADAWTEIFGLMWAYCAASVGLAVFVSVFCASPSTASLATFGTHIFATILFLVLKMSAASAIESARSVFMLCPPLALTLAFVGLSSTFARYPMTTRVPLKVVTNWLLLDSVLYVLLATYLARVLPSEYGTKEPWWFPFARLLDWWRGRNEQQRPPSTILNIMAQNLVSDDTESEEERSQGLGGTPGEKPTVIIRKLRKSFGGHVALNDVSLDLFEGEVLALLGHNGAGKSTLINMLTRLLPTDEPSQSATLATHVEGGRWHIELMEPQDMDWRGVSIYGHELNDSAVHRLLGVCPQHDVLFEHITAREHTALCACVKGGEIESTNANGDSLLRTFGLQDRYDHLGSELSGGMRRKLSAACALVGGSRFVILDEPSTGMDPLARRELWDLLSSVKPGRTLLLSTHYMDEAMALGDKVAILRYGEVVCHAPPEDVARDLGAAGYKLVCDLREGIVENRVKTNALTTFVLENVPGAGAWCDGARSEAACKVFGLPADRPIEIGNLVAALEEDAKDGGTRFGVLAVGVGAADLEDAFMRVGGADPPPCDAEAQYVSDYDGDIEEQKSQERLETATFLARAGALCAKRLRTAARDWKTLPLLLVPIGSAVAAFALNAKDKLGNRGSSSANIATIIIVMLAFAPTAGLLAEHVVAERASKLRDVLTVAGCDARCYVCGTFAGDLLLFVFVSACVAICAVSTGTVVNNHTQTIEFRWPRDASDIPTSYIYELLYNFVHYTIDIDEINIDDIDDIDDLQKKAMPSFEDDGWIENAIPVLNKLTDDQVREFEDWAVTQGYLNETDDAWRNFDIQDDDENIARWAATAPQLWFFMPLFVIHLITFSYAASHLFKTAREAVVLLPMLIICLLFAPIIVISLFNLTFGKSGIGLVDISKSTLLGVMFWGIAICSPHGALLVALASLTSNIATNFANQYPSFAATCTIAIVEASVYAAVAYALDARAAQARIPRVIFDAPPPDDEDEDVREERQRVFDLYDAAMCSSPLLIRGLRKVYTTPRRASRQATVVVAVDSLSLEISDGEIFGLLGANGSGKTSAISCLMRSTYPTAGDAVVCSHSVLDDFENAAKHLGVVPQLDTVFERLTCVESCRLFSAIRGVPTSRLDSTVDAALTALDLNTPLIRSKLAKYLSGGQRRKLVTACAIVGDPRVCLLDEPSAGLDPVSRRHLQSAIRCATHDRAAVLTSHSMEESEALCTRLAILVKGKMRALGNTTHLKRKFVAEYRLTARTSSSDAARAWIARAIPVSVDEPSTKVRTVNWSIKSADIAVARIFEALEAAKTADVVETYSLSQPSLDQVFITVVGSHDDSNEMPVSHDERVDASAIIEAQTCCGCSLRAHYFLAFAASICAVVFMLSLSGLFGDASYDDDNRDYDDDDGKRSGCHREEGTQSPCSTSSVTLAVFPLIAAIVVTCVGCCGCCCCLRPPPRRED